MKGIRIAEYDPAYQEKINLMMADIQEEYSQAITTHHSTKLEQVYRLSGQKYWIALSDEKIAGTIGIVLFDSDKAVVKRMMVHRDFRGEAIGTAKALMSTALKWAKEQGAERVYLGTMTQFAAAQRFYLKNGYSNIDEKDLPSLYPQNPMDSIFFTREI